MRKLLATIASLMLVLTVWSGFQSSVAYASEASGCVTVVDGESAGHTPGDADEVPSDSDKATPHHHNFNHSHEVGIPTREWVGVALFPVSTPISIAQTSPPASFASNRNLRPPIA